MKTVNVKLTEEQISIISGELANCNSADQCYLNDPANRVYVEEREEIEKTIADREEIIELLWEAQS